MGNLLRAALSRTVWAPDPYLDSSDERSRFYRVVLPTIYLVNALSYGIFGLTNGGSRLVQQYLTFDGSVAISALTAAASVVAFVSQATCQKQPERACAIVLAFSSFVYLVVLGAGLASDQPPAAAFASAASFAVFLVFRVLQLSKLIGREHRERAR